MILSFVTSTSSPGFALDYVALGDSIAVGASDGLAGGYVGRYRTAAAGDLSTTIALQNLAVAGSTSTDLLAALGSDSGMQAAVAAADILTLDIGGNDLLIPLTAFQGGTCGGADGQDCLRQGLADFQTNWPLILGELRALNGYAPIIAMTYYNPIIVDLVPGDGTADAVAPYIADLNDTVRSVSPTFAVFVADVALAFNGAKGTKDAIEAGYIDPDHIHPSPAGHALIAEVFRQLGYAPGVGRLVRVSSSIRLSEDAQPPVDPADRKASFRVSTKKAPPGARVVLPLPDSAQDPRTAGATLTIYNGDGVTPDNITIALDPSGWSLDPPLGYRFTGTGAVSQVLLKPGSIKLKGGGAGFGYTLDEPAQGTVAVRMEFGDYAGWCASAPAKTSGNPPSSAKYDRPGRFTSTKAPPPASCPSDGSPGTTTTTTTVTTTTTIATLPTCGGPACNACGSCGSGICAIGSSPDACGHLDAGNVCVANSSCTPAGCASDADCGAGEVCISAGAFHFCCEVCP